MGRIGLAFRAFFGALFNSETAQRVRGAMEGEAPPAIPSPPTAEAKPAGRPVEKPKPKPPARSESLTLLAALQREARFVDFIKEPIDGYEDAQIGAATREVHRECGKVLERFFGLQPVVDQAEGGDVEVPAGFDAERYRLTGKVVDQPSHRGQLVHHGWQATKCELPTWSGGSDSARIVSPAEVEVR